MSGLASAWFFKKALPESKVLVLDNHDDFGGHAKRNEFMVNGRQVIGFGGTMRMFVNTTTCSSSLPAVSFTAVILCPPSNFLRSINASNPLYDIPEIPEVVRDKAESEVGAKIFWSSCSQRYSSVSLELLWYVIFSLPMIRFFASSSSTSIS